MSLAKVRARIDNLERLARAFRDQRCGPQLDRYRDAPIEFALEVLGQTHWPAQDAIMRALWTHKRVSVRSCKKSSKTQTEAEIALAFLSTGPGVVISTAPTGRQVRELLWQRINALYGTSRVRLPGEMHLTEWRLGPEWYGLGFATDEPANVQGFHAGVLPPDATPEQIIASNRRLLWLIDEAQGIKPFIWTGIEASLSADNVWCLVAGNPLLPADDPHFFPQSQEGHLDGIRFHRIHIAARGLERCAGADECFHGVPSWILRDEWVEQMRREWGEESPEFGAYVNGEFSQQGAAELRVVTRAMLESALSLNAKSEQGRHMGVDVSRLGRDETVCALVVDGVLEQREAWRGKDLMASADEIIALAAKWNVRDSNVHVDVVGLGAGVVDRLVQRGFRVDGVDFGAEPAEDWSHLLGETRFKNRRAELHWVFRRALQEGLGHVPKHFEHAWQQAQWPRYEPRSEGSTGTVLVIEPKDDIRERYGRSPDDFDAVLLAWSRTGAGTLKLLTRRIRR